MTGGVISRFPQFVDEFLAADPPIEVIVVGDTRATQFVRERMQAGSSVPIVTAISFDLVQFGGVQSLNVPGTRMTGVTAASQGINWTRMVLLKRIVPHALRVVIVRSENNVCAIREEEEAYNSARALGMVPHELVVTNLQELRPAIEEEVDRTNADAIYLLRGPIMQYSRIQVVAAIHATGLPAMFPYADWAERGGLIGYGPDRVDLTRQAAVYVARILNGADPALLPIEGPRHFHLAINTTTAASLRPPKRDTSELIIPDDVMARAALRT
jgi:putative tryptophan/tyrosine transport system substrate-binding protein